jgi:hypothetical protein
LYRKSNNTAAELCYAGHLLIEHRCALIVEADVTAATGYAERDRATEMLRRTSSPSPEATDHPPGEAGLPPFCDPAVAVTAGR